MRTFSFQFTDAGGTLSEVLSSFPPRVKPYLTGGFAILAKLTEGQLAHLRNFLLTSPAHQYPRGSGELQSTIGVKEDQGGPLLAAATVATATLAEREETVEEFIEAATKSGLIAGGDRSGVATALNLLVGQRDAFKEAIEQLDVGVQLLPSLTAFQTSVDLRPGFRKGQIRFVVPTVLVHVDTDGPGQEIWFQLTKAQLERVLKDMRETLHRVEKAETWAGGRGAT